MNGTAGTQLRNMYHNGFVSVIMLESVCFTCVYLCVVVCLTHISGLTPPIVKGDLFVVVNQHV